MSVAGNGGGRTTRWSPDLPGFGARDYPSGATSYIVQTRMKGRLRLVTIGRAGVISEAEARKIARHLLLRAQTGESPANAREKARSTPSFSDFLKSYWTRIEGRWKQSSRTSNEIYRRRYLDDAFARRFIDDIETADVLRWFVRVTETGGPGGANRCLAMLSAIFSKAEEWGDRAEGTNPCRDIRRNRPRRFERFLSAEELARLGDALDRDEDAHPVHVAAVRMLVLTGCRKSEILKLEWRDVRGDRIQLRDGKAGSRTVWLGREAVAVLGSLPRHAGVQDVFYNERLRRPLHQLHSYWKGIARRADLERVRLHDLRHSFASHAARTAETLPMIGKLLGHRKVGSTSRYAHLDDAHLLVTAQQIGDRLEDLLSPATAPVGEDRR